MQKVNKVYHIFEKTSKKSSTMSPWKKKINILWSSILVKVMLETLHRGSACREECVWYLD